MSAPGLSARFCRQEVNGVNRRILVVDDEAPLRQLVRIYLTDAGHEVLEAADGTACLQTVEQEICHLVILDVMMPGIDGIETCRRIRRQNRDIPILILTARDAVEHKVQGLMAGADDYLVKPFDGRELAARVESLLRRSYRDEARLYECPVLRLRVDVHAKVTSVGGKPVTLTPKEFDILALLVKRPGRTYAREELLDLVWGPEYEGDTRTVDSHIKNIREKLRTAGISADPIATVWGVGYKFEAPA